MRIGFGYDIHRLVPGRKLILGGVEIPFGKGLMGHSDADVLLHAISDAVLGALGAGDIGKHFPDTDERYRDISSLLILRKIVELMKGRGYRVTSIDTTIVAEGPVLSPFIDRIKETINRELGADAGYVSVKAKTNEGLGPVGKGEGIAAYAVCLLAPSKSEVRSEK